MPAKLAFDPPVSEAQRRAMWAAAEGHSTLGIPKKVGKEFVGKDAPSGALSEKERAEAERGHASREEMPGHVFLEPEQRKYPVKTRQGGTWKYDRDLLLAAAREARMHGHEDLARRADAIRNREFEGAHDRIIFDRASARTYDTDGHLHVSGSVISSAQVNPYWGREIPGASGLGLDPNKKYMLLRDPAELEAGAPSLHGKPFLVLHKGMDAWNHDPAAVAGSVINPVWEAPDIKAELVVWRADAIRDIESEAKRDLSAGYRYVPVMDPGTHNGQPYDGRMTKIVFNHVAQVPEGRVDGALVADAQLEESAVVKILDALKPEIAAKLKDALAADASLEALSEALDQMSTSPNIGMPSMAENRTEDAEPDCLKNMKGEDRKAFDAWLKGRDKRAKDAAEEEKKAADAKRAKDAEEEEEKKKKDAEDKRAKDAKRAKDESEEEKKKREKEEAEDKAAKDAEAIQKGMAQLESSVKGMDAKIKEATDKAVSDAIAAQTAIREAERAVFAHVGHLQIAQDSAEGVYKTALGILGEDKAEISALPLPALKAILKRIPVPGSSAAPRIAMDAGTSRVAAVLKGLKAPAKV